MSGSVDHVLLTRFNLPSDGVEGLIRAQEGWLRERVRLFEEYCVPSVLAQDCSNFHWLIYFDSQSPAWLVRSMSSYIDRGIFTARYATSVSTSQLVADIRTVVGKPSGDLMTTNLDNDDGLAHDFVRRVQAVPAAPGPLAIFLVEGLVRCDQRVYEVVDRANAFCTVLEPWTDPVTCWADWHNLLPRQMPTVELNGRPGWLQVVHGANVSNRVRGRLADARAFAPSFVGLRDVSPPRRRDLVLDRSVVAPLRKLRSAVRTPVKRVLLGTIGKSGVARIRLIFANRRIHSPDPPGSQ